MRRLPIYAILFIVAAATALFYLLIHEVSRTWLNIGLRPEVQEALSDSLEDQKKLRTLDAPNRDLYRQRFERNQKLVNRLEIFELSREAVRRRIEGVLVGTFAATLITTIVVWVMRQRAAEKREREEFAARLSSYQQTARRHAHEIRTPLAAARLEVDRLMSLIGSRAPVADIDRASGSVFEELDRLARFTHEFTSFATVGQPVLTVEALDLVVAEFCETFATAWKNVVLEFHRPRTSVPVRLDRDLFRQVLANLCANSARAMGRPGAVRFTIERNGARVFLDVTDNGEGIPASIQPRVFDPYVTTRQIGEGMGLGLAIARKILLDHDGDLVLAETSPAGTRFRITLPAA